MERDSKWGQSFISHLVCYTDFHKTSHVLCGKQNKGDETITVFQNAITIQQKFGKGKNKLFISIKLVFYSEDKNIRRKKLRRKSLLQNINKKNVKNKNYYISGP